MNASTLVFDLDGTLSNPSRGIINCVNHALSLCGHPTRSEKEISAEIGPPLDLMFKKFIPGITNQQMDNMVARYRERFATDGFSENYLYENIAPTLDALTQLGFRLGVCTSKPKTPATKILKHFEILQYFDFVSGGDIGIAKQSQLTELLETAVIDKHAVMIGDRGVDLSAAHNNGLRSVGVLWGFGELPELRAENPELILSTVTELQSSFVST